MDSTAAVKKPEVLHRTKLFGGTKTAHQIHAELAWGNRPCFACGGPPAMRIKSLVTVKDLERYNPQLLIMLSARYGGKLPTVPTTEGHALVISDIMACSNCKVSAERGAAKHPSWIAVEIDRGPGDDPILVQVPGQA